LEQSKFYTLTAFRHIKSLGADTMSVTLAHEKEPYDS